MTQASHEQIQPVKAAGDWRLRRHGDYQRVYQGSRKQFSDSMTYFYRLRSEKPDRAPARVGLTAGRVLGKAVERNRIKRRMREAIRMHVSLLPAGVDVVLHPRKRVMTMEFASLEQEVGQVFSRIALRLRKDQTRMMLPKSEAKADDAKAEGTAG